MTSMSVLACFFASSLGFLSGNLKVTLKLKGREGERAKKTEVWLNQWHDRNTKKQKKSQNKREGKEVKRGREKGGCSMHC